MRRTGRQRRASNFSKMGLRMVENVDLVMKSIIEKRLLRELQEPNEVSDLNATQPDQVEVKIDNEADLQKTTQTYLYSTLRRLQEPNEVSDLNATWS